MAHARQRSRRPRLQEAAEERFLGDHGEEQIDDEEQRRDPLQREILSPRRRRGRAGGM